MRDLLQEQLLNGRLGDELGQYVNASPNDLAVAQDLPSERGMRIEGLADLVIRREVGRAGIEDFAVDQTGFELCC